MIMMIMPSVMIVVVVMRRRRGTAAATVPTMMPSIVPTLRLRSCQRKHE